MSVDARNPFPGMNPFVEQRWRAFHARLAVALADHLNPALPNDLFADVEEDVYALADGLRVGTDQSGAARWRPDVYVAESDPRGGGAAVAEQRASAPADQFEVSFSVDDASPVKWVSVRETSGDERLVTAIEIFSPTNKLDERARRQYRAKRDGLIAGGANLVEIDLLRGGRPLILVRDADLPMEHHAAYKVCVRRAQPLPDGHYLGVHASPLDRRLPSFALPLRPADADVTVPLQTLVDELFVRARYAERLDYATPLRPPLGDADAAFVRERLAAIGRA